VGFGIKLTRLAMKSLPALRPVSITAARCVAWREKKKHYRRRGDWKRGTGKRETNLQG